MSNASKNETQVDQALAAGQAAAAQTIAAQQPPAMTPIPPQPGPMPGRNGVVNGSKRG